MKIHLDRVVDQPFDWQETLTLAPGELDQPEVVDLSGVECRGQIRPLADDYLLEASLSSLQTLRCMRCLESFERPSTSKLSFLIQVRKPEEIVEEEVELDEEDLGSLVLEQSILDTRPMLIEQLHLEVPMKPLCRRECAGLCANCGKNLNRSPCQCGTITDPRWSALEKLKTSR